MPWTREVSWSGHHFHTPGLQVPSLVRAHTRTNQIYRNYYKGHMDKIKGEGGGGRGRWVQLGWGGGVERKGIQL